MRMTNPVSQLIGGILLIVCVLAATTAQAHWQQWYRMHPPDAAQYDHFGLSVGISGDYAVIGTPYNDDDGINSGSAYIMEPSGSYWVEHDKLTASDAYAHQNFGRSVCIDGDYAIVGATGDATTPGAAYVFKRLGGGWSQLGKLTASDGVAGDKFGWSVSIDGEYAIVGAHFDDNINGTDAGSAYLYEAPAGAWTNMPEIFKFWAPDGAGTDQFGSSVSISGDYAIAGASFNNATGGTDCGAAYVFSRDPDTGIWAYEAKLTASDGSGGDWLGYSVAVDGNYAIAGAVGDDEPGGQEGSTYIFERNGTTWTQRARLLAADKAPNDYFGSSVAISGDYAVVSAPFKDANGVAYIFRRSGMTWSQLIRLSAGDGVANDRFGTSVAIDSDAGWAIVGAESKNVVATESGAAYAFEHICPSADSTGDCYVSYEDLKEFCDAWLDTADFVDFSDLGAQWHTFN